MEGMLALRNAATDTCETPDTLVPAGSGVVEGGVVEGVGGSSSSSAPCGPTTDEIGSALYAAMHGSLGMSHDPRAASL